jgi:hypothetical protein
MVFVLRRPFDHIVSNHMLVYDRGTVHSATDSTRVLCHVGMSFCTHFLSLH